MPLARPLSIRRRRMRPGIAEEAHIPAPIGGLNTIDAGYDMPPADSPLLYNVISAENGLRSRLGYKEWCTSVGAGQVPTVMPFHGSSSNGSKDRLFATSGADIYDVSASSAAPTSKLTFASAAGDAGWGVFSGAVNSASGHFLLYADEENGYHVYTEASDSWAAVTAGGGATQINGLDPTKIAFVKSWKKLILFVEKDSSRMWLVTAAGAAVPNSIYGTVTSFDFGSQFKHGGHLVGLWSWTRDGGNGMDDFLVAIGSGGDIAIYTGTDPADVSKFACVGVWFVGGVPAGRRIATDFGGDLLILSTTGVVSISKLSAGASEDDPSQYATRKIGNFFARTVQTYAGTKGWSLRMHPEDSSLIVTAPPGDTGQPTQLAMSLLTKAWFPYRGLPIISAESWGRKLYFGTADGRVCINTGYLDNVNLASTQFTPIDCSGLTAFRNGGGARQMQVMLIRPKLLSEGGAIANTCEARYKYDLTEASQPSAAPSNDSNVWDTGLWDVALWGGAFASQQQLGGAVGMGSDFAIAFRFKATSRTVLTGFDVVYAQGGVL